MRYGSGRRYGGEAAQYGGAEATQAGTTRVVIVTAEVAPAFATVRVHGTALLLVTAEVQALDATVQVERRSTRTVTAHVDAVAGQGVWEGTPRGVERIATAWAEAVAGATATTRIGHRRVTTTLTPIEGSVTKSYPVSAVLIALTTYLERGVLTSHASREVTSTVVERPTEMWVLTRASEGVDTIPPPPVDPVLGARGTRVVTATVKVLIGATGTTYYHAPRVEARTSTAWTGALAGSATAAFVSVPVGAQDLHFTGGSVSLTEAENDLHFTADGVTLTEPA